MNIRGMIIQHLKKNGYDGLYYDGDCGCELDDLFPCGEFSSDCKAGYKMPCTCEYNCPWHIGATKGD